ETCTQQVPRHNTHPLELPARERRIHQLPLRLFREMGEDQLVGGHQEVIPGEARLERAATEDAGAPGRIDETPLAANVHCQPGMIRLPRRLSELVVDALRIAGDPDRLEPDLARETLVQRNVAAAERD